MNRVPCANDTLSESIQFRAFPGMSKDIRKAAKDFPDRFDNESSVIRAALMKLFCELDKDREQKYSMRRRRR